MKIKKEGMFGILMGGIIVILLLPCFRYSFTAKIVPFIVGVPALGLITLQLMIHFIPAFSKKWEKLTRGKNSSIEDETGKKREIIPTTDISEKEISKKRNKEINIFTWVVGLMGGIYLFGYLIAVPLFIFLFLKIRASSTWLLSITLAILMEILVYVAFMTILRIPLYKGLIFTLIFGK